MPHALRRSAAVLLATCSLAVAADNWTPVAGQTLGDDGRLHLGGLDLNLVHYDTQWKATGTKDLKAAAAQRQGATWKRSGTWTTAAGEGTLSEELSNADGAWTLAAAASNAGPTASFALNLTLPGDLYRTRAVLIDQQRLVLPATSPEPQLRAGAAASRIDVPLPSGGFLTITGTLKVLVQDNKKWDQDTFTVRLVSDGDPRIAASLRVRGVTATAITIPAAATRPRRDDVDGDHQGGWTDQGDNDLRVLSNGALQAASVGFTIGDGAVVLAGDKHPWLPRVADIPLSGVHGSTLYLLHAIAWAPKGEAPIGTITATYADGTSDTIEVKSARDVADWWNPQTSLPNGALGWEGNNGHANIGLYVARFALRDQPLTNLRLATTGTTVWMVPGIAVGEDSPLPFRVPSVIKAGERWLATPAPWEVLPGSALDLSDLGPAPVAGRVVVEGDHFALAGTPGKPLRLLGANLCFTANFPEKADAERMAKAFRAMGHNAVRIHHYDNQLTKRTGDGTELDPEQLDKLDYLLFCCKREGLWITTDLYVSRVLPKGALPEVNKDIRQEMKLLIPLLPSAMENWKKFSTNFLTHRNPYTGMTLAEDPALATLSLVNEDNMPACIDKDPELKALADKLFDTWLTTQPASAQAEAAADPLAKTRLRGTWMWQKQRDAYVALKAHVVALGVKAPTTGANMMNDWWTTALRDGFDIVDNHSYFDHPHFPVKDWQLPFGFGQGSPLTTLFRVPSDIAASRRLDRPFTVTELNYCLPNHNRSQYAAAVPGMAGLQGWSGIWRFAFSHTIDNITKDLPAGGFDLAHDPIALLGERAMALLWRRGDVAPATWTAAIAYTPEIAAQNINRGADKSFGALALYGRIGILPAASAQTARIDGLKLLASDPAAGPVPAGARPVLPADGKLADALQANGLLPSGAFQPELGIIRSPDGQLTLDAKAGTFAVATARSVAVVLPGKSSQTVAGLTLANPDADQATVIVAALDAGTLATSRKLLVLHLTDALNSGMSFADQRHTLLENWGKAPVLVRDGHLVLTIPGDTPAIATALDLSGAQHDSVPLTAVAGGQQLDAVVAHAWGPCLAWSITR